MAKNWAQIALVTILAVMLGGISPADAQGKGKVTICHIPPGNPGNAHTISVSQSALPAHLAHSDYLGPCQTTQATTTTTTTGVDITRVAYTELVGTVLRYDADAGVVVVDDEGTAVIVALYDRSTLVIQVGVTIYITGQQVDEQHFVAETVQAEQQFRDSAGDAYDLPPVLVDVTGQVESYDAETDVVVVDGLTVILIKPVDFAIEVGMIVTFSGELLPDGRCIADLIEPYVAVSEQSVAYLATTTDFSAQVTICHIPPGNPANAHTITVGASAVPAHLDHGDYVGACEDQGFGSDVTITRVECNGACNPSLIVLSDALNVRYEELAAWQAQGFQIGVIARMYLVADVTQLSVDEVAGQYKAGKAWKDILKGKLDTPVAELGNFTNLGDGRGHTIRDEHGGPPARDPKPGKDSKPDKNSKK